MTLEEYQQQRNEIIAKHGQPEYDIYSTPTWKNESGRLLKELEGVKLAHARAEKKVKTGYVEKDKYSKRLSSLNEITLLDEDLKRFTGIDKDIIRDHFIDRHTSHKTLANRYQKSYQYVAGLLKSDMVLHIKAKYFNETLNENTQIALMKLTQDADPKIVLVAAEYLKLLQAEKKDSDNGSKRIVDPLATKALSLLTDWLTSDMASPFTITRDSLQ